MEVHSAYLDLLEHPGFKHFQGLILNLEQNLRDRLERGDWDSLGHDMTPYNRMGLWLVRQILAYPGVVEDALTRHENIMGIPTRAEEDHIPAWKPMSID